MIQYEEYRSSGIDWLGEVPAHWTRKKFRLLARGRAFVSGPFGSSIGSQFYVEMGVPVIRGNNLSLNADKPMFTNSGYVYLTEEKADELSNATVKRGDLVFTARGTVGQVGLVPDDVLWSRAILSANQLRFRNENRDVSSRFLWYLFSSWFLRTQVLLNSDSVAQPNLNLGSLKSLQVLTPTLEEQTQIANFLDYETGKIDALIEKQQQLIALLKEKRQAVISHAVTKGLNPNAPMRDSGIEWLGKVPAHWGVINLNRVVRTFVDYRGRTPEKTDDGRPLVTAGAVRNGIVDLGRAPQFVSEETYHLLRKRGEPEVGDLLFTSEAPLGEVAIVEDVEIACAQRIIMFKLDHMRIQPQFIWLYLRSQAGRDEILTKGSGSTAEGIRADRLKRCRVLVPPLEEQAGIVSHVERELGGFDEILQKSAEQTALLQERRTALISAAVTGKIDVRNWKAPESKTEVEVA